MMEGAATGYVMLQNNNVAAAMQFISTAKADLAAQHQKAAELKSGMDIFNISQPSYKELAQNEKVAALAACSLV